MGLFMLGGAKAEGESVVPDDWVAAATRKQADIGAPGQGYGYQWWTEDNGAYDAIGIFGQAIHIDPRRKLVVVLSSAWPHATGHDLSIARKALFDAVDKAVDAESDHRP